MAQICNLPAIVFRAIQYLQVKKADQEEGIYRLSGSSAVIKNLKDMFNSGRPDHLSARNWGSYLSPLQRATLTWLRRTSTGIRTRSLAF